MSSAAEIIAHITGTFDGVQTAMDKENTFFLCRGEQYMPFATLVTADNYDTVSNLNRPGIFRLNIGIGKTTFLEMFGTDALDANETSYDYTVLDEILPHPVYAKQHWVCVLNPAATTLSTVQSLLTEAYEIAARRQARHDSREGEIPSEK